MSGTPNPQTEFLWRPYTQMQTEAAPLLAMETDGARIRLADGRWLIDGVASWWTACHGYNHPHILEAMHRQLDDMPHVMFGGFANEQALALGQRLSGVLPGADTEDALTRVFFSDSGSVAVEIALKMATQYWHNKGETGRRRFVSFRYAYHGDTMGAMSVCDPIEGMHTQFKSFFPNQINISLPSNKTEQREFETLLASRRTEVAAVIIEPLVQAAGGMKFYDVDTLVAIRAACLRQNVLFIADEIATGFGRTGSLFACDTAGVIPDIICIGKALSGGTISLAATVANKMVFDAFLAHDENKAFMHGPTYMANPLACAAANASLDLFEDGERLRQVSALESKFSEALDRCRNIPDVADVRVKGAIGVVQLTRPSHIQWLREKFLAEGVWIRPFGDVVYLMPPFTLSDGESTKLCDAIVKVVKEWSVKIG